ncbi:MAG: hypothetical protein JXQ65_02010 [Candidatus Marinimicrobia bacterium]|nr:hypothetical protein [Candidatus Neomarinimicrobiota bacterium]
MNNKLTVLIVIIFILSSFLFGDDWRVSAGGGYSLPLGGLREWFKSGYEMNLNVGKITDNNWVVEGMLLYSLTDRENLSGYADGKLKLELQSVAIWANGKYLMGSFGPADFYFNIAGGPIYWKSTRGEVEADEDKTIPHIDKKVLEEWNMGFRSGFGAEFKFGKLGIDALVNYKFIAGSLWPTMQEHIELEGVNGLQSLNVNVGLFYNF